MQPEHAYAELVRRVREEAVLSSCSALLEWDEATYMPPGGVENRSQQMALLAVLLHDHGTDPQLGELLAAVEGSSLVADPDSPAAVNVRELRRAYDRERKLPRRLVEEDARITSLAQQEWVTAREQADGASFLPWLEKIVELRRTEAECLGYPGEPYDALVEDYEPGVTSEDLERLFGALRAELVPLVGAIAAAPRRPKPAILHREFPVDRQRSFGEMVAAAVGFDFERGRLDTSAHPFSTSIGPGDCRITTRFDSRDLTAGLFAILHEVGHAIYDQGLEPEHAGTPMGEQVSLGVDESQSRLWENAVGRSRAFWEHFFPAARDVFFRRALKGVPLDDFHFALNAVEPSLLRARADEVTYNLHVLVRFELERALLRGDLRVADVPAAWADAYRTYLGVAPRDDAEGFLQDGHWAEGLIGYFPTYTLGNVYAAQLFRTASRELGDLDAQMARGDFGPLRAWLRERVHRHGHRWPAARLIERATGARPDPTALVETLRAKYGALYGALG